MPKVLSLDFAGTLVGQGLLDHFWLDLVPLFYSQKHGVWLSEAKDEVYGAYEEVGKGDVRWYDPRYWFERFGMPDKLEEAIAEAGKRMEVYPDVVSLKPLESKYSLVICSTVTEEFLEDWAPKLGLNISAVFSAVSDFGMVTKDELFYRRVAEALGVSPGEVVHVGDDYKVDFEAPRKVGCFAVLLDRQRQHPDVHPSVASLSGLPPLLERLSQ
jgi:putative hydrolase of the HAD superfamily